MEDVFVIAHPSITRTNVFLPLHYWTSLWCAHLELHFVLTDLGFMHLIRLSQLNTCEGNQSLQYAEVRSLTQQMLMSSFVLVPLKLMNTLVTFEGQGEQPPI